MSRIVLASVFAAALASGLGAQAPTPFKLGTFERQGTAFVGIVLALLSIPMRKKRK